ncbi:MAG: phosphoribosylformylglycinamidine synthase subunit PurS [Actinomycetota bacterium]|nr:phosphoribosylformylglycinamidine synthase subunit PurS [Actinomycetota bacterium]
MLKVDVYVTLKKEILDTQGLVIKKAIPQIGYHNVEQVRFGKYIQLKIDDSGKSEEEITGEIEYLCDKLLSNPIIEDFRYEISRDE